MGLLKSLLGHLRFDKERIVSVMPALPEQTRILLLGHGHYDHLFDVAYYLTLGPSTVRGTGEKRCCGSAAQQPIILLGFSTPSVDPVFNTYFWKVDEKHYEAIRMDNMRITPFLSNYAPHFWGVELFTGESPARASEPNSLWDYKSGPTFNYFIDYLGDDQKIVFRIFVDGAASSPEAMGGIDPSHPVDVAIL